MAKVAIWSRSPPKDKRTFPCNAKSKLGHHIADRPKEADELKAYGHCEGDTIVSCSGDTTALYSLIERVSDFQWTVKMSRNTEQCLHGALRRIVDSGAGIKTVTHDNGMESRSVKTIERILRAGGATGTCAFYADAYASNQRARNEKNHTFHRRFLGHGGAMFQRYVSPQAPFPDFDGTDIFSVPHPSLRDQMARRQLRQMLRRAHHTQGEAAVNVQIHPVLRGDFHGR